MAVPAATAATSVPARNKRALGKLGRKAASGRARISTPGPADEVRGSCSFNRTKAPSSNSLSIAASLFKASSLRVARWRSDISSRTARKAFSTTASRGSELRASALCACAGRIMPDGDGAEFDDLLCCEVAACIAAAVIFARSSVASWLREALCDSSECSIAPSVRSELRPNSRTARSDFSYLACSPSTLSINHAEC